MRRRTWLFVIPFIASLLWVGAPPGQATTPSFTIDGINSVGCATGATQLPVTFKGTAGQGYTMRTTVTSNGLLYMNEHFTWGSGDIQTAWGLYDLTTDGPPPNKGTWPIPNGHPITIRGTLEKPTGNVVWSWTMVLEACDSGRIFYNDRTSLDTDGDYVKTPTDKCPKLKAIGRADGCPLRARSLTLAAKTGPKRVGGRLYAAGFPTLYANRPVVIWKIRSGPDLKVATLTSSSGGYFSATVGSGYYYATSSSYRSPSAGVAAADQSPNVHVP